MNGLRCLYTSKPCDNIRSMKENGQPHRLCDMHRARANEAQRRWLLRQRGGGNVDAASGEVVVPPRRIRQPIIYQPVPQDVGLAASWRRRRRTINKAFRNAATLFPAGICTQVQPFSGSLVRPPYSTMANTSVNEFGGGLPQDLVCNPAMIESDAPALQHTVVADWASLLHHHTFFEKHQAKPAQPTEELPH